MRSKKNRNKPARLRASGAVPEEAAPETEDTAPDESASAREPGAEASAESPAPAETGGEAEVSEG